MSLQPGGEKAPAGWYAWMLGGLLPILLAGFAASAVADRLVFAGWALAAGAAYAAALHRSFSPARPGRPGGLGRGLPLLTLGVAGLTFAALAIAFWEDLSLGVAAFAPPAPSLVLEAGP